MAAELRLMIPTNESVEPDDRQLGKVINFATFAGQGASALALQLNVSPAQAKEWLARFDRRYALVRARLGSLATDRGASALVWPLHGISYVKGVWAPCRVQRHTNTVPHYVALAFLWGDRGQG